MKHQIGKFLHLCNRQRDNSSSRGLAVLKAFSPSFLILFLSLFSISYVLAAPEGDGEDPPDSSQSVAAVRSKGPLRARRIPPLVVLPWCGGEPDGAPGQDEEWQARDLLRQGLIPGGMFRLRAGPVGVSVFSPLVHDLTHYGPGLVVIDLGHLRIGDEGAEILANALPSFPHLGGLYLKDNDIGPEGVIALTQTMGECPLHTLALAHNHMGKRGAEALAVRLPFCRLLHVCDIRDNQIRGGKRLLASVRVYCPRLHLCLEESRPCVSPRARGGPLVLKFKGDS